jgi:hypothetical protein
MDVTFKWTRSKRKIAEDVSGCHDHGSLLFLATVADRLMMPYVPARNLILSQNTNVYVENNHGVVEYNSPYAHYQYEGKLYVDPTTKKGAFTNGEGLYWSRPGIAKVPSGRGLKYNTFRHPKATSHWDKAMMVERGDELARAYENYIKSGG